MDIIISELIIENYRSIKKIHITFDDLRSLFFGENNSGKTNILKAIHIAFNNSAHSKEDVFISIESPYSKNKEIKIYIKISPYDYLNNKIINKFNPAWAQYLGDKINPEGDFEYFAFLTQVKYDESKKDYIKTRKLIFNWESLQIGNEIQYKLLEPFDCYYIPAKRDLVEDILNKNSIWNKYIPKIEIEENEKIKIAGLTKKISDKIIKSSNLLESVKQELQILKPNSKDSINLEAISQETNKLYNGINIYIDNVNNGRINFESMGSGTRSRSIFQVIKAIIENRLKNISLYAPILLLEEPEANLHPNLQKEVFNEIAKINCQLFVATHSNWAFCNSKYEHYYHVINKTETIIKDTTLKGYGNVEKQGIYKEILNNNAGFLFSTKVVFAEGKTEEIALPIYYKKFFGKEPFYNNVSIVGVGGPNYKYFLKMANDLSISWFIFSDGEPDAISKLQAALKYAFDKDSIDLTSLNNVIVIPNNCDYEKYLQKNGYSNLMIKAIDGKIDGNKLFKEWMKNMDGQYIKSGIRDYHSAGNKQRALEDFFNKYKTDYAIDVANFIVNSKKKMPPIIKSLLDKLKKEL